MWVGLGVWCGGCGVGGGVVKNVYFRRGLGWGCGVICVVRFEETHSRLEYLFFC